MTPWRGIIGLLRLFLYLYLYLRSTLRTDDGGMCSAVIVHEQFRDGNPYCVRYALE